MIAVVQRVIQASVDVEATGHHASIGDGLCILLGVEAGDTDEEARWIAGKIARLRIFRDDRHDMNRSVEDVGGEVLVVSQFTLAADTSRGRRPSFVRAAAPELAESLYERFAQRLRDRGLGVATGTFQAMMQVELVNDGPVTILLEPRADRGAS